MNPERLTKTFGIHYFIISLVIFFKFEETVKNYKNYSYCYSRRPIERR